MKLNIKEKILGKVPEETISRLRKLTPLLAFTGGFTWDSLTLTRVDNIVDNAILFSYLVLLGISIVLMYLSTDIIASENLSPRLVRLKNWYPNLIQFFMGGLFSSYVVFYFHSASMSRTLLFVFLLAGLLVANEFLKDSLRNIYLTMGLYFFVAFAFFTFAIPVTLRTMSYATFLGSGLISLMIVSGIAFIFFKRHVLKRKREMWALISQSVIILIILNVLYTINWIPPVPLSVKQTGIYHNVEKKDSTYELTYAKPRWYEFWRTSDTYFRYRTGDKVFCFTSIFAPTELTTKIYHHWQMFNVKKNEWQEVDKIGFNITGGRGQGWRGYTYKKFATPGRWRVDIRTEGDLLLGQVAMRIVESDEELTFITDSY